MAAQSRLADAGFLVALWKPSDQYREWALLTAKTNPPPWIVCEAVLSETDHLLRAPGRATLRTAIRRGALRLTSILAEEPGAVLDLMEKYEDVPMSFADACLVRLTEVLPDPLVLTTDADFKVYRRHSRQSVPCIIP
jgi:predicted nucleic acid-binding protein